MKNKMADRKYDNCDEFEADMRKLVNNFCFSFPVSDQHHKSAVRLQAMYEQHFKTPMREMRSLAPRPVEPKRTNGRSRSDGGTSSALAKLAADLRGNRESLPMSRSGYFGNGPVDVSQGFPPGSSGQCWTPWKGQDLQSGRGQDRVVPSAIESVMADLANGSPKNSNGDCGKEAQGSGTENSVAAAAAESSNSIEANKESSEKGSGPQKQGSAENRSGGECSTPAKRVRDTEVGGEQPSGDEKRAKLDEAGSTGQNQQNIVDLSMVKQEYDWETDNRLTPPSDTGVASLRGFACRWLYDGVNAVACHENVMNKIKALIGVSEQERIIEFGMLEGLDDTRLEELGQFLINFMFKAKRRPNALFPDTEDDSHAATLRMATDAITDCQSEWNNMQQAVSSIRTSTYETSKMLNRLEEQGFDTWNKLHEAKGSLQQFPKQE